MKKRFFLIFTGAFALVNLFLFILYYISTYRVSNPALLYTYTFVSDFLLTAIPLTAGAALTSVYAKRSFKPIFLWALPISLTHIIYLFPTYAFEYAYAGYKIGDVMLISALTTLFGTLSLYVEIILLSLLIIFVTKSFARRRGTDYKDELLKKSDIFNLYAPSSAGIFAGALVLFIYDVVLEIKDTVVFIGESAGVMTVGEIVYITVRYLFLMAVMLGSSFMANFCKNKATSSFT